MPDSAPAWGEGDGIAGDTYLHLVALAASAALILIRSCLIEPSAPATNRECSRLNRAASPLRGAALRATRQDDCCTGPCVPGAHGHRRPSRRDLPDHVAVTD